MLLVMVSGVSLALRRFSRIRSKTTIVSFKEYPISVRKAAIIARLILKSPIPSASPTDVVAIYVQAVTAPSVMHTSCTSAAIAAIP